LTISRSFAVRLLPLRLAEWNMQFDQRPLLVGQVRAGPGDDAAARTACALRAESVDRPVLIGDVAIDRRRLAARLARAEGDGLIALQWVRPSPQRFSMDWPGRRREGRYEVGASA
jgi:hypothetical protein